VRVSRGRYYIGLVPSVNFARGAAGRIRTYREMRLRAARMRDERCTKERE